MHINTTTVLSDLAGTKSPAAGRGAVDDARDASEGAGHTGAGTSFNALLTGELTRTTAATIPGREVQADAEQHAEASFAEPDTGDLSAGAQPHELPRTPVQAKQRHAGGPDTPEMSFGAGAGGESITSEGAVAQRSLEAATTAKTAVPPGGDGLRAPDDGRQTSRGDASTSLSTNEGAPARSTEAAAPLVGVDGGAVSDDLVAETHASSASWPSPADVVAHDNRAASPGAPALPDDSDASAMHAAVEAAPTVSSAAIPISNSASLLPGLGAQASSARGAENARAPGAVTSRTTPTGMGVRSTSIAQVATATSVGDMPAVDALLAELAHAHEAADARVAPASPVRAESTVPTAPASGYGIGSLPAAAGAPASAPTPASVMTQGAQVQTPVGAHGWDTAFASKVLWLAGNNQQVAELHLNPAELGPVAVTLELTRDEATAHFVSGQAAVREAIEAALPRLREALAESGINLGQAGVSAQSSDRGGADQSGRAADTRGLRTLGSTVADPAAAALMGRAGSGLVDTFA